MKNEYHKITKQELHSYCDSYLSNDTEAKEFCKKKNIPPKRGWDDFFLSDDRVSSDFFNN